MVVILMVKKNTGTNVDCAKYKEKAVITNVVVMMSCVVMYTPSFVSIGFAVVGIHSTILCNFSTFMLLAVSAVNPYVHCLRNPSLNKLIRQMVTKRRGKRRIEDGDSIGTLSFFDGEQTIQCDDVPDMVIDEPRQSEEGI